MRKAITRMIGRYGTPMTLEHDGEIISLRAFLQETGSESQSGSERQMMALGEVPKGLYVYIGPAAPAAVKGDVLILGSRSFQLRRAELVMVGTNPVCCWGICVERGSDTAWGV